MANISQTKYIFVTGGVLSGLGKGITAASLGTILKARGFSVNIQKLDPYFNTDAGTLNPAEHGEVFVTHDGAETDLDLGHYERFLDEELGQSSSVMNGRIYAKVIADERAGKYLGKTVQIIPHVTNEIQEQILAAGQGFDFHLVEVGGTVGDYESQATLEALRQFRRRVGTEHTAYLHLVYLPYLEASHELKSKPAQNTVRDLREAGIHPDVILARAERPIEAGIMRKLSLFCDVDEEAIVALPTVKTVYEVPLMLEKAGLADYLCRHFGVKTRRPQLADWQQLVQLIKHPSHRQVTIGVVAKYMDNEDAYMSVFEAIKAAGWANQAQPRITWIDAEALETAPSAGDLLRDCDGLVVPGGFGERGVEGKIRAADWAIEQSVPYLGLCLGMQVGVIAFARRHGLAGASSTELNPQTPHPVIHIMEHQKAVTAKGGTMRLGDYACHLVSGSQAAAAYGVDTVRERHRHRYEFNNAYRGRLAKAGLSFAGLSPDGQLVEIVELLEHPFFMASQFHPEFKSRPGRPHPMFNAFMAAALQHDTTSRNTAIQQEAAARHR
ncbi:MAG TPA: CTP synthase [Candidatus Saccharimonadia bacterium]|nr:CTP synthase [Candidatus Saccharimonadia bacterium]